VLGWVGEVYGGGWGEAEEDGGLGLLGFGGSCRDGLGGSG